MSDPQCHIHCKECSSPLVQASDWARQDAEHWHVRIWCPECGHERRAILGREDLAYLSHAIENGFISLLEALAELQDELAAETSALDVLVRLRAEQIAPEAL